MSLDQNLFTLFFTPNPSYPAGSVVDLVDGAGTVHYRKRRVAPQTDQLYRIEVTDPLSDALLASANAPSATSKHKTLELYNPSNVVELKHTGTLTFRWSFKWETHEFEWKREECYIIRKPDPPVLVAVTKEPPGRTRTLSVQILDYNLNRFDIDDRKGLEIVILTALLTFQDSSDSYHDPNATTPTSPTSTSAPTPPSRTKSVSLPPPPPPKPAPKKGVERIAELQFGRGQVNEVTVLEEGAIADYAKHCAQLLQDDAMLFISVRSSEPNQVPKVLHVVEEIKRRRHKAGDQDLHQYVLYDTNEGAASQKGPRVINLDDNDGKGRNKEYLPPSSLTVHLSKIDMPELRPRGAPLDKQPKTRQDQDNAKRNSTKFFKTKERDKDKEGRLKRTSSPPRGSTLPSLLHSHRSQYFPPASPTLPSPVSGPSFHPPPLPPRHPLPQTMQGSFPDRYYYHDYDVQGTSNVTGAGNTSLTSGLLGRFLGR